MTFSSQARGKAFVDAQGSKEEIQQKLPHNQKSVNKGNAYQEPHITLYSDINSKPQMSSLLLTDNKGNKNTF